MITPVHIFFNNRESVIPENSEWEKFEGHDSLRLALFAAESWRRQGWDPKFFNTRDMGPTELSARWPFKRLSDKYPLDFYLWWYKVAELAGNGAWFSTIDVFNFNFKPEHVSGIYNAAAMESGCLILQKSTFSYSCFWCDSDWAWQAICLLLAFEDGRIDVPPCDLISDEHVLRNHAAWGQFGIMAFMYAETDWQTAPLLHLSRSCLQHPVRDGVV